MNLAKSLIVLGSGGAITTGAYLTKSHWMPTREKTKETKSIKDVLAGKKLISSISNVDAVKKQWEAEFDSASDAIKVLLSNTSLNSESGGKALETWCSKQMSLNSEENGEVLENVEKYCLIRKVSSQISRKGKNLLNPNTEEGWSATYQKRKTEQSTSNRSDVNLKGEWQEGKETEDLVTIKGWCSDNSEKDFLASEQEANSIYTKVLKWCTKEGV